MTCTNRDVWTSSFLLSGHMWWSVFSVDVHMMRDPSWLLDPLWCATEYMRSVAHVLRSRQERKGPSRGTIPKCAPHERSLCAHNFGERSHEETLHQERCVGRVA